MHKDRGFTVLGFPANNFGGQEPGSDAEIRSFYAEKHRVTFPLFAKISAKGADIHPLYRHLTAADGGDIPWNFTKFLVGRTGKVLKRFGPRDEPQSPAMIEAIEAALK